MRLVRRPLHHDPDALPGGLHPVLRRVYAARRVPDAGALDYSLARLPHPERFTGLAEAAEVVADAVRAGRRIVVCGDFDADGATGCAVAVLGLRACGATGVSYLVPDRFRLGYGLTPALVDAARGQGAELLITVDNGIAALEGVDAANAAGLEVVITDHHLPGPELPAARAIVNPQLCDADFPARSLAGVGVLFYLLLGVRAALRASGWFGAAVSEPNLAELLDLVALGTIADVVPLDHANRILVANGLGRIRAGRARPGLAALLKQGGRSHVRARTSDLAFAAAPRLNAAGRLDDMTLGVECLLAGDAGRAQEFALRLEQLNLERRAVEAQMAEQAAGDLEALVAERQGALPAAVCLTGTDWHAGVVGIVAGRIKDRVHRPVVAFAPDGTDALKGSARSVAGVHVREVLAAVDAAHPGLIERFGGHAAAAGLTIAADRYAEFRDAFVGAVERLGEDALSGGELASDGPLAAGEIGHALARALADGGPWGPGFEEPVFDNRFEVLGARVVGDAHLKLDLRHPDGGGRIDAIAFNQAQLADGSRQVHLAYRLDLNTFRGVTAPQLVVEALDPVA
ncbi:MAG: single-stranded-DNA-specific exonuclease RecJ [Chromatiales bacterium]|nr:single-stranded-DNA-specific exonuclease RecJ [Chromatiales bacterium]